jgi:hypothetical protein
MTEKEKRLKTLVLGSYLYTKVIVSGKEMTTPCKK